MQKEHPFLDSRTKRILIVLSVLFILLFGIQKFILEPQYAGSPYVIRAAVDIGSGATKLRVAEVNLATNKIEKILVNESFSVPYQEQLEHSPNRMFNESVMRTGIDALKKSQDIARQYHAQKVVAVATAAFRNAANSEDFSKKILEETGITVNVIDQELEGKLAFEAVASSQGHSSPTDLIVWDIGGGSFQFTSQDSKGNFQIYRGTEASVPFKNRIIQTIQNRNIKEHSTPHPITVGEIRQGEALAREIAQKVDQVFKDKIQSPKTEIVGVGNIFAYGIYPLVGNKKQYKISDLTNSLESLADKSDLELGGGDFVNVKTTNAILVLGFMQGLKIQEVQILDLNNADGALLYPPFWF